MLCTTIRRGCSSRRTRTRRRGAHARRRHRLRHHRQRRDRAVRRRRSADARRVTRARSREQIDDDLGPDGPIAAQHRALRGSSEPARDGERRSRRSTTTAASGCSRRAPASASRSAISCRRCAGRRRTASARSCRRTRSTCRSSSSARICRFSRDALSDQPVRFALLKGWRNYLCLSARAGARVGATRCSRTAPAMSSTTIQRVGGAHAATARLRDLPVPPRAEVWDEVAAEPDLCQRAASARSSTSAFCSRRAASGAGGRDRRQSSSAALRSRRAPRAAELGRRGGAARVSAARRRRRTSSRGRGGVAPRRDGLARGRCSGCSAGSIAAARGCSPRSSRKLESQNDLLSTASLDLRAVASRARRAARARQERRCCSICSTRYLQRERASPSCASPTSSRRIRSGSAGLACALEDTLGEIELLPDGLQLVRERMESERTAATRRVAPLLNEMRAVARRLAERGRRLAARARPRAGRRDVAVRWIEVRGTRSQRRA